MNICNLIWFKLIWLVIHFKKTKDREHAVQRNVRQLYHYTEHDASALVQLMCTNEIKTDTTLSRNL